MVMTLPLDEMSLADKILAMEILWDDLCRNADGFSSPAWHGEQLKADSFYPTSFNLFGPAAAISFGQPSAKCLKFSM